MNRREFLTAAGAASMVVALHPRLAYAADGSYGNLLILIELKGGNDGLNTVVPFAEPAYYDLRPRIGVPRDQVLQLDARTGLHPAMKALLPLWEGRELAIVQGVGYPAPNLSHFRSIEIWDTASKSNEYLAEGWLARAFVQSPVPRSYAADGVIVGGVEMGPLGGGGARTLAITSTELFRRQARLAAPAGQAGNAALRHILKVEQDIVQAAAGLDSDYAYRTEFSKTMFGNAVRTAAQVAASRAGVAAIKISLNGFDTHGGQLANHGRLLGELADGIATLKRALVEVGRWNTTLIATYSEFGRRPQENQSGGTDHGTANAHLLAGGRVKGGLYGVPPALARLDGGGNLPFAVDFRDVYATFLERWWGVNSTAALGGRFKPLDLLRA